jgi:hypothetical protein
LRIEFLTCSPSQHRPEQALNVYLVPEDAVDRSHLDNDFRTEHDASTQADGLLTACQAASGLSAWLLK